jgi:hypothetical protein
MPRSWLDLFGSQEDQVAEADGRVNDHSVFRESDISKLAEQLLACQK